MGSTPYKYMHQLVSKRALAAGMEAGAGEDRRAGGAQCPLSAPMPLPVQGGGPQQAPRQAPDGHLLVVMRQARGGAGLLRPL